MRIVKPLWLKHGGERRDFEIYSCHVSADGSRLVTAAGDGYVRIWSTEAVYKGLDPDFSGPKQLAALSYHSGTIHAVRFSGNGKYLASGADDKYVCIYTLDPTPPAHTTFGSNEAPPVENWRIFRRLIQHENDVQDVGWSPDSSLLVSVGLDSRVVVWSGYTFEKLKTISVHNSHVKGVTFDPANKYFATASDDRTIRIFRYTPPQPNSTAYDQTNNFMLEATIADPFANSPLTTYFRRCSWSPDGTHIAAANAVNGPVSTAAIINRGNWDSDINLVGHEGPIEVCSFSPRIFSPTPPDAGDPQQSGITVIACAGQDRSLSIWNTTSTKPLVVSEGLTVKSISDLAWAPDGENLFFASLDGTIALASFSPGELGYPLALEINDTNLARFGGGRKVGVLEGREALALEEMSKTDELRNVQGRMGELMGDGNATVKQASAQVNGKGHDGADADAPMTNGHAETADIAKKPPVEDANQAKIEKLKQRVTITKDGKKRVAPLLVTSAAGSTESSLPATQLMRTSAQSSRIEEPQNILDLSKPYDGLPKGGLASLLVGNKRKLAETGFEDDNSIRQRADAAERQGAKLIMANTADGLTPANRSSTQPSENYPSLANPGLTISQIRLATPQIRTHVVRPLHSTAKKVEGEASDKENTGDAHVFEVKNPTGPSRTGRAQDKEPARILVTKKGQTLWQDFLPRPVMLVTGNVRFWAATCDDGSLYVWSPAGRRMFNSFTLEAQVVILDCRGPWLLAISAIGLCHVWDIAKSSSPYPPVSLAPVLDMAAMSQGLHLTNGPSLIFARLNSEGRIFVAMSNGDAFVYSPTMFIWQRVSEAWWAVGSQYWNTTDSAASLQTSSSRAGDPEDMDQVRIENISAGIIPLLERNTTSQTLLRGKAYFLQRLIKSLLSAEGYEGFESGVSVAHLENRLAAALTLGAKEEFKQYLSMYAKRLGAEGARLKIEELLRSLLAGVYDDRQADTLVDGSTIHMGGPVDSLCGWKKETLLKEVILILGKYRDLQRITVPYARILGMTQTAMEGDEQMEG